MGGRRPGSLETCAVTELTNLARSVPFKGIRQLLNRAADGKRAKNTSQHPR